MEELPPLLEILEAYAPSVGGIGAVVLVSLISCFKWAVKKGKELTAHIDERLDGLAEDIKEVKEGVSDFKLENAEQHREMAERISKVEGKLER